jgi:hypothetical protein
MTAISGSITGVSLLAAPNRGIGALKAYEVTVDLGVYAGGADTLEIPLVGATIDAATKNGKTSTLNSAVPIGPGYNTTGGAVYMNGASVAAMAISTDSLTGELCDSTIGNEVDSTASTGHRLCVTVTEA